MQAEQNCIAVLVSFCAADAAKIVTFPTMMQQPLFTPVSLRSGTIQMPVFRSRLHTGRQRLEVAFDSHTPDPSSVHRITLVYTGVSVEGLSMR